MPMFMHSLIFQCIHGFLLFGCHLCGNQIPMNSRPRRRTLLHFALLSSRHAANLRKIGPNWGRLFVNDTTAWINHKPIQNERSNKHQKQANLTQFIVFSRCKPAINWYVSLNMPSLTKSQGKNVLIRSFQREHRGISYYALGCFGEAPWGLA